MKTLSEINEIVKGNSGQVIKSSYYTLTESGLIRVSNHLPLEHNLENNNEDVEDFLFIFCETELTEIEIENHLENISFLEDKNYDYVLINEDEEIPYLEMKLRLF